VRDYFVQKGWSDPTSRSGKVDPQFRLLLRGIERDNATKHSPKEKKPLTLDKMADVIDAISALSITLRDKIALRTAILFAFWGFFRVSEFCVKSTGNSFLRRMDVKLKQLSDSSKYLTVDLRSSKGSQFKPVKVYIYPNASRLCPVAAMEKYLKLTAHFARCKPTEPLFWLSYEHMSTTDFNSLLKDAISHTSLDPKFYTAHCLRSGAATSAYNSGVSPELIMRLGRWSSDCYKVYIKKSATVIRAAHRKIETSFLNHT
jgi:integrase